MTNNDVLRRIRYIKNYNDQEMIEIFNLASCTVSRDEVSSWLKKDDHSDFQDINDVLLATFLTGLITKYRGQKEGAPIVIEDSLTNNIILRKVSIAFSLRSDEVLDVLKVADFRLSKGELSAFFRKPDHKNYRECKSQVLRNFFARASNKVSRGEVSVIN